jgi:hypothetical protein
MLSLHIWILLAPSLIYAGSRPVIWRDPGPIEKMDFAGSMGYAVTAPRAPFQFEHEDKTGTQPKLFVRDAAGAHWNVKFGYEVKPESFCWRLVHATGYFAEPSFFVARGRIEGLQPLTRKSDWLGADGTFRDARFQWRDPGIRYLPGHAWSWDRNPFLHSKQLNGLKILIMLFSNYDNKDSRVGERGGPNTAVFETADGQRWYAFTDWGAGFGRWGNLSGQSNWRCADYTAQSAEFVLGVRKDRIRFGYVGHIPGFSAGITRADVAWLLRYLGRVSDDELRAGLRASGATPDEEQCFAHALKLRIEALRSASRGAT